MPQKMSFLICGAQKSGTSALHQYLKKHPEIDLPEKKELHIFDDEHADWSTDGINSIDGRISHHFKTSKPDRLRGEATPISLWWEPAMRRIWQYNPQIKLIAILRNPITRAYAHWKMEQQRGEELKCFYTNLEEEEVRCRNALPLQDRVHSYLSRGFYSEQIRRAWRYFPRKQLLTIKQEDLLEKPEKTLQKIYTYLCIGSKELEQPIFVQSWRSMPKQEAFGNILKAKQISATPPNHTSRELASLYTNEIQTLEKILGWNCRSWLNQ